MPSLQAIVFRFVRCEADLMEHIMFCDADHPADELLYKSNLFKTDRSRGFSKSARICSLVLATSLSTSAL